MRFYSFHYKFITGFILVLFCILSFRFSVIFNFHFKFFYLIYIFEQSQDFVKCDEIAH